MSAWLLEPGVAIPLLAAGALYVRGRRRGQPGRVPRPRPGRAAAFLGALATVAVALASPVETLAAGLLQVHMAQHLALMMVAPPLIWLGAPLSPLLRGLPRPVVRAAGRGLGRRAARLGRGLAHPVTAWTAFFVAFWAWHAPALYELALRSHAWHHVEHACFFASGLLFWWPVVRPWPSRPVWPRWTLIPYLVLADVQNTALSAILTFADHVVYPSYAAVPRPWAIPALQDQATAGVVMWVPGSVAFLLPLAWLVAGLLAPRQAALGGVRPAPLREQE